MPSAKSDTPATDSFGFYHPAVPLTCPVSGNPTPLVRPGNVVIDDHRSFYPKGSSDDLNLMTIHVYLLAGFLYIVQSLPFTFDSSVSRNSFCRTVVTL